MIPETKEISNEYESLDRPYILKDDIFSYIVAHEMIEHDDIEPCSVEQCLQEQIGLKTIQDNYIILFDKWTDIWFGSANLASVKPVGHR